MAATAQGASSLLANLKNRRQVTPDRSDAGDVLERTMRFLEARETSNPQDATHQVLKNYSDWWCGGQKNTKKLAIAETGTLEVLYEHIAKMYELGAPLTLGETRTEQFSFFQDIEIRGNKDNKIDYRDIAGPGSAFLRLLGRIMAELYPGKKLQVIVLDASGLSYKFGMQHTLVRLVWQLSSGPNDSMQNIVVNSERAFRIVDYMVLKVSQSTDPDITEIERRATTLSTANIWKTMFACEENYGKRTAIRMTLNDDVCDPPMLRPENRPLKPVFIHQFSKQLSGSQAGEELQLEPYWSYEEEVAAGTTMSTEEYAKFVEMTTVRQASGAPITDWEQPKYKGEQRTMTRFQDQSSAPARQGAHIKLRTVAGSPDPGERARSCKGPGPARNEEPMKIIDRSFPGDMEEFKSKIEGALQGQDGNTEMDYDQETVIWTSTKGATIVFRQANHNVRIQAKEGLCRVYLNACPFLEAAARGAADSAMERGSTRAATSIRLGGTNAYAGSRAPSQAFAPKASSAAGFSRPMSLAGGASAVAGRAAPSANSQLKPQVPYNRVVTIEFEPESEGELRLCQNETIQVIQDDGDDNSLERWVCGRNLETGAVGWFPLNNTRRADQAA